MANPSTREQLKSYCLRKLGQPVIKVNVADEQVEDRIDEALQFWREYHFDATEVVYLKSQVTASTIALQSNVAANFSVNEKVVGGTSGATAIVVTGSSGSTLNVFKISGTFANGETLTGETSGQAATLASSAAVVKGTFDDRYFPISDAVIGITRVLPLRTSNRGGDYMWDVRYQLVLNDVYSLVSTDIISYYAVNQYMSLLNQILTGVAPIRFNRHTNRLYVDMNWESDVTIGDYVVVECLRILDPNEYSDVYNDMVLKKLAVALIKKQWGENMKKFSGVQLPGGVELNGDKIWQEAVDELEKLEDEMQLRWELPPMFSMA